MGQRRKKDWKFWTTMVGVPVLVCLLPLLWPDVRRFVGLSKSDAPSSPQVNVQNGIAITGGVVANPTVNNFVPPPLELKASLRTVASDKEGLIQTEITIVPTQAVSAPFGIALEFDNPIESIWFIVKDAGATIGGGPYRLGTHALTTVGTGISPSHPLVITVHSVLPVKLLKSPTIE